MKKKLVAIVAVIISILMSCSIFAGCKLTTTNNAKDMAQVVAEINIGNAGQETDKVYKKDLVMAYLSYGYLYSYYYGYTGSQIYEMLVNSLVGTRVMVQTVMAHYESADGGVKDGTKAKWDIERYLTSDEIVEAKYNAIFSLNSNIDGYMKAEEKGVTDTLTDTVRTTPTGAENKPEEDKTVDEMTTYIGNGVYDVAIGGERHKAYNQLVKLLSNSGLLNDYEGDVLNTEYYKNMLKNQEEQMLLDRYSEDYQKDLRKQISYDTLKAKYEEMYNAQVSSYGQSTSAFEDALSKASNSNPIVYSPYTGYGFVYNLLLGVDDVQTNDISNIKLTEKSAYDNARRTILSSTTVKDLRSSWILSGYDFDYDESTKTGVFTGDYTANENVSLPFQGVVSELVKEDKDNDVEAEYRIDNVKEFGLDEFISFMENYVYGSEQPADVMSQSDDRVNWYKKVTHLSVPDYEDKINELLFAFSTDPGSLNTYKGYIINPERDVNITEQWVHTFASAGRELLNMKGSSYIVVASDYGYHVMFFSSLLGADVNYGTLDAYLNSIDSTMGGYASNAEYLAHILDNWEDYEGSDLYLYNLASLFVDTSTAYSAKQNEIVSAAKADENKVKIYTERYSDLG